MLNKDPQKVLFDVLGHPTELSDHHLKGIYFMLRIRLSFWKNLNICVKYYLMLYFLRRMW